MLYGEAKSQETANTTLKEKNKVGGLTLPDFKPDFKLQSARQSGLGEKHKNIIDP